MNKKIFLIILALILLLIAIIILNQNGVMSKTNDKILIEKTLSDAEIDEVRKKEKDEWINNHKDKKSNNVLEDFEIIEEYKDGLSEELIKANKKEEIMNRFYGEHYKKLADKIIEDSDRMEFNEIYKQSYIKEYFELIIDVFKNKDISVEERDILKEFLLQQYDNMYGTSKLKTEIEKALNN